MFRKTFIATVTAATCGTALLGTPAAAQERVLPNIQGAYPQESYTQYRHYGRSYDRRYYGGRHYGRSYHRRNAVGAGIAGLAAGAIIGGAIASAQPAYAAPPPPPYAVAGGDDWIAYCSQRYRSFDPATGTYLGHDRQRHVCR